MNDTAGKPHRVRKLEFLIDRYREMQWGTQECSSEWHNYERIVNSLRTEYVSRIGIIYQEKTRPKQKVEDA